MFPKMMCNVGAWCQEVPSVHRLVYTCTQGNSWDDGLVLAVRTDRNLWPQHIASISLGTRDHTIMCLVTTACCFLVVKFCSIILLSCYKVLAVYTDWVKGVTSH